jgi:hypothetical protein
MSVSNPFVDPDTRESLADKGQPVDNGVPRPTFNPCIVPGIPVMSPDPLASLDVISLG